jgi:hypothetical protein
VVERFSQGEKEEEDEALGAIFTATDTQTHSKTTRRARQNYRFIRKKGGTNNTRDDA